MPKYYIYSILAYYKILLITTYLVDYELYMVDMDPYDTGFDKDDLDSQVLLNTFVGIPLVYHHIL